MDVDTRARRAADAVRGSVEVDLEAGLQELAARGRRRRVEGALAVAAAVVLGVVALEPLVGSQDDAAPATDRPVSTIFYDPDRGAAGIGALPARENPASTVLIEENLDPADMAVSPDGSILAVVDGKERLTVIDAESGRTSTRYCATCFEVAWLSDGELATRGLTPDGTVRTQRHDVAKGEPTRALRLPEGTPLSGISPGGDLAASVRAVPGSDAHQLVVTPLGGGAPVPLVSTTTAPGGFITDVVWSPDASRIGYVVTTPAQDEIGGERYHLDTVLPDGSYPSEVADLGRCVCSDDRRPSFAWSPDGNQIAAVVADSEGGRDRFRVVTLDMDEVAATAPSRRDRLLHVVARDGGSPVAWGLTLL